MKRIRKLIELRKRDWEIIGIVFIGCKLTMYFREVLKEANMTKLKLKRLEKGLYRWQVAGKIGVSEQLLYMWETGKEVCSKGDNRVS